MSDKNDETTANLGREFQSWSKGMKMPNSEKNDFWTPQEVFDSLNERFGPFTLDAAASEENRKVEMFYDEEANSLKQNWKGKVWCNPPYVKQEDKTTIKDWVEKAWTSVESGQAETVVLLIPAYTATRYWHDTIYPNASHLVIFKGRLNFEGPNTRAGGAARNPSVSVVFSQAWSGSGMQLLRMSNKGEWLSEENYDREVLKLKLKNGVEAFGSNLEGERFVVHKNSTANLEPRPSMRKTQQKAREALVKEGALVAEGNKFRFTRDVTFNSPSLAASLVRACSSNGRKLWKTA